MVPKSDGKSVLRRGFTTGACAAAAARAAYAILSGKAPVKSIPLLFPDGQILNFKLNSTSAETASASVVKDAGDDPDVTDKAVISARISKAFPSDATDADHLVECGSGTLIIRGGSGVGLATRAGLSAEKGKWAINPVPLKMIAANLKAEGFGDVVACLLLVIEVENGIEIAKRTLNPVLGVVDGISILGTSGFVEPYSNAAYIDTIKVMVSGAKAAGSKIVVLCTGGSTLKAAMALHPELPDFAFIRIADFIEESLRALVDAGFGSVVVACMEGKLLKYASGLGNTHAWRNAMSLSDLKPFLLEAGLDEASASKAVSCPSVREAMSALTQRQRLDVISMLSSKAADVFKKWVPSLNIEIDIFDSDASPLFKFNERPS